MQSMNYGELPTRQQFRKHFKRIVHPWVANHSFQMHLKGSDASCAEEHAGSNYYGGDNDYDVDELWHILVSLHTAYDQGSDCAGDLASSILYVLDFEWI